MDEIASEFFMGACRTDTRPNKNKFVQWSCAAVEVINPTRCTTTSGSISELYIEPMLSCVGDVDIMRAHGIILAVPSIQHLPHNLPAGFSDRVIVFEVIDSPFPSYVTLHMLGELTSEDCVLKAAVNNEGYLNSDTWNRLILLDQDESNFQQHGPALKHRTNRLPTPFGLLEMDRVDCIRCLSWPIQAYNWRTRRREHGWPDTTTIRRIVKDGCDVVHAIHQQCRRVEQFLKYQWRLSFSRPETVLLNSWTPIQQNVYHILRFVLKQSGLCAVCDRNGNEILSRYHIKTLMLWSCEVEQSTWWIQSNIVCLCCSMLQSLLHCCMSQRCPGYFVEDSNLIESIDVPQTLIGQLKNVTDSEQLTRWLIDNYVKQYIQFCPENIQQLFEDISTPLKFQKAVREVIEWRVETALEDSLHIVKGLYIVILNTCLTADRYQQCADVKAHLLEDVDPRLNVLFQALTFLRLLRPSPVVGSYEVCDRAMNILTETVVDKSGVTSSPLQLGLTCLMAHVRSTSSTMTSSILTILAHVYLRRAMKFAMSVGEDTTLCLARVYLAVLYYFTGQDEKVLNYCRLVLKSNQTDTCVVEGRCLPRSEPAVEIGNALGISVLFQFILTKASQGSRQQSQLVSCFSARSLANYLLRSTKLLSNCNQEKQKHSARACKKRFRQISDLFVTDFLLHYLVCHRENKSVTGLQPNRDLLQFSTKRLPRLLVTEAVKQLTTFHEIMSRDYGTLCTIATTDIQALYAYRCREYQQCLKVSIQNVRSMLNDVVFFPIPIFGCMTHLMDDSLASLSGLALLVSPKMLIAMRQLMMSLFLVVQSKMKLHHGISSLRDELSLIKYLHNQYPVENVFDRLLLSFMYRKTLVYLVSSLV